ncbi:MAG: glycosyltransferase family 2 protein [Thermodesulfovibrionia bacterium]|nr:glycosyltransferase family 2 protein [Thermodesulfovibrionia bacterium]
MDNSPFVSVIIPAHNSGAFIERCISAVLTSSYPSYEVIVVDDASTDDTAETARRLGATVIHLTEQSGPSAARNYAVSKAMGEIIFFVDSDVEIKSGTISRVADSFQKSPDIAALFGSYDDEPAEKNFLSQYKNLFHHYIHQQSSSDARTFWAGCGAIRKDIFKKMGGFDHACFAKPSIEDIEIGLRIKEAGYRILLDKELQVKHLKQWRLKSFLRAEIIYRAIPWSNLILENNEKINDLNLKTSHRVSAGLTGLSVLLLPFSLVKPQLLYSIFIFQALVLLFNIRMYRFFFERRGLIFAVRVFLMQVLYYLYSGATFVICWIMYRFLSKKLSYD